MEDENQLLGVFMGGITDHSEARGHRISRTGHQLPDRSSILKKKKKTLALLYELIYGKSPLPIWLA